DVAAPGSPRVGEHALPHGGTRSAVDARGDPRHGRLPGHDLREEGAMRELVARYLSQSISRRTFLKGLTTAGLSATAARSVLDSLVPVAHAQAKAAAQGTVAAEGFKAFEGT